MDGPRAKGLVLICCQVDISYLTGELKYSKDRNIMILRDSMKSPKELRFAVELEDILRAKFLLSHLSSVLVIVSRSLLHFSNIPI